MIEKLVPYVRPGKTIEVMKSRIDHFGRGKSQPTAYGKRMDRLSQRIFTEITRETDSKSMKVVRLLSSEPPHEMESKSVKYYPPIPMLHYLSKLLYFHGLFFDEHVIFRNLQNELKKLRGKELYPVIGQGKRAQLRAK